MWRKLCQLVVRLFPDSYVQKCYMNAGADFGEMVSYIYMGKCVGFDDGFERWAFWESEHARRGFHTVEIDDFCDYGEFVADYSMIGRKRRSDEPEILHAERSRIFFIEGYHSTRVIDETMRGNIVEGQYSLPSSGPDPEPYKSVFERE